MRSGCVSLLQNSVPHDTLRFAMLVEPVCDYRSYLRTLSCDPAALVQDLRNIIASMTDKDLCAFELGVPGRNCQVGLCPPVNANKDKKSRP